MTIVNKNQVEKVVIDLTGEQGNAFYLLGKALALSREIGLNEREVMDEMKSGDYENLIKVFDKHFGMFYTLVRG